MFLLKKVIEAFLLPPGILVVALGALGAFLWKRSRPAAVAAAALAAVTWVGSSKVFCDALVRPLENAYHAPAKPKGDVIVLLCAGFKGGGNPYSASERLASGTLERAAVAYKLYKETRLPLLISGGAPFSAQPESEAAAAYLMELGVPASAMITEKASRDTYENAVYSLKLCREKGFKRLILLTSAHHMPRAVMLFRKAGAQDLVPFPVAGTTGGPRFLRDYLPGGGQARQVANEYLGLLFYSLQPADGG